MWRPIVAMAAGALALAACGDGTKVLTSGHAPALAPTVAATAPASPAAVPATSCRPGVRRTTTSARATILYVVRATQARRRPRPGARVVDQLGPRNAYGVRTVLLGLDALVGRNCAPRWYRAKLPAKPNGVVAWVPAGAVQTGITDRRVVADLSRRLVIVYRAGRAVFRTHVAVGASATPTPTGRFFVESRFHITDAGSPYGPAALAIAAYSDADQGWTRGNPIAIHGTNEPASIGTAASHGCLRMHNDDVLRMMSLVPAGTPVEIRV